MFGKKKRGPLPKGQGAAAAKQMGLFVDMDPGEMMMGMDENLDDPDLEAELAAITGNKAAAGGRAKQKGRTPLPMEDIAKMADECMRDVDEDEDDADVEDDEALLVCICCQQEEKVPSAAPGSLQHTLEERITMYKTALQNAKTAGETSKARRYDRGLKNLQSMLASVKKGKPVNEAEIPPPVATGAPSAPARPAAPQRPPPPVPTPPEPTAHSPSGELEVTTPPTDVPEIVEPVVGSDLSSSKEILFRCNKCGLSLYFSSDEYTATNAIKTMLLERQKEYKIAALRAKKQGDVEQAKLYFRTSKRFDAVIEALEKGQAVDLSDLPLFSPAAPSAPAAPKDVLEALEQRRAKYVEASAQAKASGDDRKARMHDRIAKQYQSAIRAHKAGKAVNFDELPVPPGFPPIPGHNTTGAEHGLVAALEAANKLASTDEAEDEGDDEEKEEEVGYLHHIITNQIQLTMINEQVSIQQLEFLEGRKKQYLKAALQAKQKNDMEQAKTLFRTAKGFDPMIEAARSGKSVDISKVPSPPGDEDDDFILVHHSDVQISEKAEHLYTQLAKILKEQYEKCMTHSKQFMHLGNVTETTKFEKMAESCKKSLEVLKLCQGRGLPPPKHHFEERSFHTVRIFPELSSTEMVVTIVKGMNLPAPSGIQTNDLDAYVKFDFPYPSTFCVFVLCLKHPRHLCVLPSEYNQSFTLSINRNHRGFRRVVTSKGLKLELLHKGGFLRSDKPIGTSLVKLENLETQSEIREIVEVMDGRKHTGGRVEVKVRLREPLSGQDLQTSTERWLVIDPSCGTLSSEQKISLRQETVCKLRREV
uniref:C2 domain-containing protein n=1 Tax=Sphaeramia orbicularis TaxID=375764 RepID=A0A673BKQ4_9TELE